MASTDTRNAFCGEESKTKLDVGISIPHCDHSLEEPGIARLPHVFEHIAGLV